MNAGNTAPKFKKVFHRGGVGVERLIIAVHGMGDQVRNEMVCDVAKQMAKTFVKEGSKQALRLPQGLWEGVEPGQPVKDDVIRFAPIEPGLEELAGMGFAEIYWSDLPRIAERDGKRLEDSPKWAGSVVDRLRQRHDLERTFSEADVTLGATVVEEVAETLRVLNNLLKVTDQAGVFKFDLGIILAQYLGDVQQVADFRYVRESFEARFSERIEYLARQCPGAQIHFVAHSEGSVLALRALLTALHRPMPATQRPEWISRVESLTTLGSPIDKHLILWPEIWGWLSEGEEVMAEAMKRAEQTQLRCAKRKPGCAACGAECEACEEARNECQKLQKDRRTKWHGLRQRIRWRNYYDLADPVGYDLDTARQKLRLWGCEAFEFEQQHDSGFRRYPLAGKAHVDYFGDVELFRHLRASAIEGIEDVERLGNTNWGRTSPIWPFVIVAALHIGAVLVLHQGMAADALKELQARAPALELNDLTKWVRSLQGIFACGMLLLGTTVCSRLSSINGRYLDMKGALVYAATAALAFLMGPAAIWKSVIAPSAVMLGIGLIVNVY